jgi:hypothetical protein
MNAKRPPEGEDPRREETPDKKPRPPRNSRLRDAQDAKGAAHDTDETAAEDSEEQGDVASPDDVRASESAAGESGPSDALAEAGSSSSETSGSETIVAGDARGPADGEPGAPASDISAPIDEGPVNFATGSDASLGDEASSVEAVEASDGESGWVGDVFSPSDSLAGESDVDVTQAGDDSPAASDVAEDMPADDASSADSSSSADPALDENDAAANSTGDGGDGAVAPSTSGVEDFGDRPHFDKGTLDPDLISNLVYQPGDPGGIRQLPYIRGQHDANAAHDLVFRRRDRPDRSASSGPVDGESSVERPIVLMSLTDGQTRQIINDALSAAGARDGAALEKIAESKVEHAAWVRACHERAMYG